MAANVGADMVRTQFFFNQLHGRKNRALWAAGAKAGWARLHDLLQGLERNHFVGLDRGGCAGHRCWLGQHQTFGAGCLDRIQQTVFLGKGPHPFEHLMDGVFARRWQQVFAVQHRAATGLAQHRGDVLLHKIGLALFHQQDRAFALAKAQHFGIDHGVGDVHHIQGHPAAAIDIGQAQALQHPHQGVVIATLHHDAHVLKIALKKFIQLIFFNERHRRRPALGEFFLLVHKARGRQHNAADIPLRLLHGFVQRKRGAHIVTGGKTPMHMAGTDAQLQHHRGVAGFGQLKTHLDGLDHAGQVWPRVEQPNLRLHGKCMAALLHDGGTFAVVLADHDQCATGHATGGQVGQGVGGDIGAHRGLEGDRAAQGVIDRSGQGGCGRGLAGAVFKPNAVLLQNVLGVGQHIDQVGNGCALVAGHIRHA